MPAMLRRATLFAGCAVSFAAAAGRSLAQTVTAVAPSPIGGGPTYPFSVPPLPYAVSANEPYIDAQTMELHHDKHHAAYVANLNAAVKDHSPVAAMPLPAMLAKARRTPGGDPHDRAQQWRRPCKPLDVLAGYGRQGR